MLADGAEASADLLGVPAAAAGGGALVAGLVCLVGLGEGRTLVPPTVVGAVFLATGSLIGPPTSTPPSC